MGTMARGVASHTPGQIDTRLQRHLIGQLDGVVEFADFCAYLTPAGGAERSQMLIDLAQGLYEETLRGLEQRFHQA